jgi:hypothetical protein
MLFHFEISSNDVRRNSDFIFVISSAYPTSKPVQEENFRDAISFFLARLMVDPRKKDNWHRSDNVYFAPKEEE